MRDIVLYLIDYNNYQKSCIHRIIHYLSNIRCVNINSITDIPVTNGDYIVIVLTGKYIGFTSQFILNLGLNDGEYIKFDNNYILHNSILRSNSVYILEDIDKYGREQIPNNIYNLTIDNYNEIRNNKESLFYYSSNKLILYKRLLDELFPDKLHITDNLKFNDYMMIDIFMDKRIGFIYDYLKKILNINYGTIGGNISLTIYNAFNKTCWVKAELDNLIKNSTIPNCSYKFINYANLDNNITEQALEYRKLSFSKFHNSNCNFYFTIDVTHMLDNPNVFSDLYSCNKPLIVPLLNQEGTFFSNFWTDILDTGFYKTSDLYFNILNRSAKYIYNIPYFNGTLLINKQLMNYNLESIYDSRLYGISDIDMDLCNNLRQSNIQMHLNASQIYGRIINNAQAEKYWEKPFDNDVFDLFLLEDSMIDWEHKFIDKNIIENTLDLNKIKIHQPAPDLFSFQFFTPLFCSSLITISNYSDLWSIGTNKDVRIIGGHENVPTRDIHLNQLDLNSQWDIIISNYICHFASHLYSSFKTKGTNIIFIVKYSMEGQTELSPHHDSSSYTILITLNNKFKGGGTHFIRQNYIANNVEIGTCTIHPGRLTHYHSGIPITSGERYILVGFID